jgi:hypothetical protein
VPSDEASRVDADRYFISRSQSANPNRLTTRRGKYVAQIIWSCEVNRIIKSRVCSNAALESACGPINFAEQLDLEPSFSDLNYLGRFGGAAQFGDTQQTDLPNEINEPLRYPND